MSRIYSIAMTLAIWLALVSAAVNHALAAPTPAAAEMDRVLAEAFHADAPGAAVLVVQNGQPLLRKGYGLANMELQVAMDPAAVSRICSMTKEFTAVAILQLAEAGTIKLDDPIEKYVPDYPTGSNKVTIRRLLAHTSGFPSFTDQKDWMGLWRQDMTLAQLLALTKGKPLEFEPGTNWKYSNSGYLLLGAAIEKASGLSYADYLQRRIFAPAQMTSSSYDSEKRIVPRRNPGYVRDGKSWANAPYISMTQPFSAGGLLSSVDDLWKWERALETGKLLSLASLAEAQAQIKLPDGRDTNYGLGWEVGALGKHPTHAHGGGMPGFSSYAIGIPDASLFIAILSNTNETAVPLQVLAERLARIALGEKEQAAPPVESSQASLADYAGVYRIDPKTTFGVSVENGKLVGQLGPGKRPLTPSGPDAFSAPGDAMKFVFLRDATHRVDRVSVHANGPGPTLDWPRVQ